MNSHQNAFLSSTKAAKKSRRSHAPPTTRRILQRAYLEPGAMTSGQVLQLQRIAGNRSTQTLLRQPVQCKLLLGPADDPYEREADGVARQAVRHSTRPPTQPSAQPVQAKALHGLAGGEVEPGVARAIEQKRGGGQALDRGVAGAMGRYFSADFSGVRVHTGAESETLNRSLNAKAFTTGNDIFFGKGQYNPGSSGGQELIAHELSHVVQQGGGDVQRQFVIRRDFLVQRDDDDGPDVIGNALGLGDIGGAIVEVYEAYNGDESASAILKAVTELAGGIGDTKGGLEDTAEGATGEGVGAWSSLVGGVTGLAAKGSGLMSTLAEYGRSALDYVSSFGYGSDYIGKVSEACAWLGGWAKSASEVISPYAFYTDLIASSTKAVKGMTEGWAAGESLQELAKLVKNAASREVKKAAEYLFNLVWWKRVEGYSKSAVGAIEGGAAIFLGPLSKGLTAVATKAYEGGWMSYVLRAIGSSFTSQVFSNAQVKARMKQDARNLYGTAASIAAGGKIKDVVLLCKAAVQLGMADFAKAILNAFDALILGGGTRHQHRKEALEQEVRRVGIAKEMGLA